MIKFRGREQILAERHKTDRERRKTFAFHTERTRGQIRFEPVKDSASYSKPRDDKILWSIVSNATDRSKRQTRYF